MNIIAMTLGMITVGNGTIIQNLKAVGTGFPPFVKITNEKNGCDKITKCQLSCFDRNGNGMIIRKMILVGAVFSRTRFHL